MKKVSGKLKLELAAFRELETFAKFGSDLDKATQAKLSRGIRMVEMLKQPEHTPIPFEKQSVMLYASINGYLDTLSVHDVKAYEQSLYSKLESTHAVLADDIRTRQKLTEDIEQAIKSLVSEVRDEFVK